MSLLKEFTKGLWNENAVFKLLEFLGFSKVEKLTPLHNGLEERYYNGNRCTFLAVR